MGVQAKPALRLIIMLGGVTVNFLLGVFLYSMILYVWNDTYLKNDNAVYGVSCSEFAKELGFKNGDKILAIDGLPVERFSDISKNMVLRDKSFIVDVERPESFERIVIGNNFIKDWKNNGKEVLFSPRNIVQIENLSDGGFAEKAGLLAGDILVSVNGVKTKFFDLFKYELYKNSSNSVTIS